MNIYDRNQMGQHYMGLKLVPGWTESIILSVSSPPTPGQSRQRFLELNWTGSSDTVKSSKRRKESYEMSLKWSTISQNFTGVAEDVNISHFVSARILSSSGSQLV